MKRLYSFIPAINSLMMLVWAFDLYGMWFFFGSLQKWRWADLLVYPLMSISFFLIPVLVGALGVLEARWNRSDLD